ncbi:MAG TPA: hypothetical protein VGN34_18745, partial [Ktedonobacteraceae bacterium]
THLCKRSSHEGGQACIFPLGFFFLHETEFVLSSLEKNRSFIRIITMLSSSIGESSHDMPFKH